MDADRAPAPPRPLGHRVVRWFLVACALVAVAELSYLVVANGCARTMLRAMAGRAGLELELGTVRTLYPGHLVVQDLAVRDARARWAIHAQAGRFSLELGALLRGSLHLRAASVTGARIVVEPSLFSSVPATASVPPARSATALSAAPRASVRLDHLEGTLRSVRTGAFELLGPVRVTLEDGRFDGSGASVRGCIELADAALHHAAATAALVRGQVDFELGSASTTRLRRLSGTARLSGRIIGVPRALSPVAPEALIDGAAFEASLAFERGEAPDGSALRLELGRAVLQHADGGTTRCGRGSTLLLAFRKHERAVRVELRAPVLEITDREGSPLARLEPLVASLDLSLVASSGSVGTEAAFGEHERRRGARLCGRAR
ncbi:MAG TPA: hypothetical protein VKY73_22840, partial [Polyangiaceae bacterium]|nr:hypothetical protein [Polyangiaceae bacterium]